MSSRFNQNQKIENRSVPKKESERAADERSAETLSISTKASGITGKEPAAMMSAPIQDNVVNLEGRQKAFMYIPMTLANADQVWQRVVEAMRSMDSADFNEVGDEGDEPSYDCYSLKYLYDSFVLARTRLVRLEEDGDQIYIELRKLEGDGFAFTDDFQRHLEKQLEDITKPDERPEPQPKPEAMWLDLSDEILREEIVSNWFTSLRPVVSGNTLVYNEIEAYKAISSLGWNTKSPENFEILKAYGEEIVECSMNVLNATSHLPTAYFAALTLNEFAKNKQFNADWSHVKMMSGAIVNWSEDGNGEFASMQVGRSREVVRLLSSTLLAVGPTLDVEGKKKAEMSIVAMLEKLQELANSEDYANFVDVDAMATALSM